MGIAYACSSSPPAGTDRGSCFSDGTCDAGLECLSNLCVRMNASGTDGSAGTIGAAGVSGAGAAGTTPSGAAGANGLDAGAAGDADAGTDGPLSNYRPAGGLRDEAAESQPRRSGLDSVQP